MKNDENKEKIEIWALIVWIIIILGVILSLLSCSPQYHFEKFQKKGGQIEYKSDCTADSVSEKINVIIPPPKWRFRLDNKRFRDSLNTVLLFGRLDYKRFNDSLKHTSKVNAIKLKQSGKTERTGIKQSNKTDRNKAIQVGKTERTQIKQTNKTERRKSNWLVWVIVGVLIKPTVKLIYRKARDGLIRWRR